jgi:predicted DNA-binding transcriptional regulator YafY
MDRSQRITRINALLKRHQGAGMDELIDDLEVSRATICRDLEAMRDQMNAPIVWDREARKYRLGEHGSVGPTYMVPGLWLSPAQAYAYLTLHNMVQKMAPKLLGPFLEPMRGTLKQMLGECDFQMYGLDKKIEIEMPDMPALHDLDFGTLLDALLHSRPVRIETNESGSAIEGIPRKLKITPRSWLLTIDVPNAGRPVELDVAEILAVNQGP